jgi:hypothetical protein
VCSLFRALKSVVPAIENKRQCDDSDGDKFLLGLATRFKISLTFNAETWPENFDIQRFDYDP